MGIVSSCATVGTETERHGGAEDGGEDGQDVDELAQPPAGAPLADQRGAGGGDELRPAHAERRVGDGAADDGVRRPRDWPPVQQRMRESVLGAARRAAGDAVAVVAERLVAAVEQQPDAHAGGEHHGDPPAGGELGLLAVAPQADVPERRERQGDHRDEEHHGGDDERPPERVDEPRERRRGRPPEALGHRDGPHGDGEHEDQRRRRHAPVDGAGAGLRA
nr:hypothetical protein [Corynebacterium xerosis]